MDDDALKAAHTLNQKKIWDTFLSLRIKLQPLMIAANRLPLQEARADFMEDRKVRREMRHAQKGLLALLSQLLRLQNALIAANPSVSDAKHDEDEKEKDETDETDEKEKEDEDEDEGSFQDLWREISGLQRSVEPHFLSVIDGWAQRTSLASSKMTQSSFKSLHQSVGAQLAATLQNKEKLRDRTRTKRTAGDVVGASLNAERFNAHRSTEIFDDTDFYQHMLRDLVDGNKSADDPFERSRNWLAIKEQSAKMKRPIERNISKDRVLRFDVQEKLVGYMAPVPLQIPPYTEQIFNDLFKCKKKLE